MLLRSPGWKGTLSIIIARDNTGQTMVLILDGNSEHVSHSCRKIAPSHTISELHLTYISTMVCPQEKSATIKDEIVEEKKM